MAANALLRLCLRTDLVELGNGDRLGGSGFMGCDLAGDAIFWGQATDSTGEKAEDQRSHSWAEELGVRWFVITDAIAATPPNPQAQQNPPALHPKLQTETMRSPEL
jgi:hypothetical protein